MTTSRISLLMVLMSWSVTVGCDDDKSTKVTETTDGVVLTTDEHGGTISTSYRNGVKHGEFLWLRDDGGIYQTGEYIEGDKQGLWVYDDITLRVETYYEMGLKCGEEQHWTIAGDVSVLQETRFYVAGDLRGRGQWECTDAGQCHRLDGVWVERSTDGDFLRRSYGGGSVISDEPVSDPTPCHSNLFDSP